MLAGWWKPWDHSLWALPIIHFLPHHAVLHRCIFFKVSDYSSRLFVWVYYSLTQNPYLRAWENSPWNCSYIILWRCVSHAQFSCYQPLFSSRKRNEGVFERWSMVFGCSGSPETKLISRVDRFWQVQQCPATKRQGQLFNILSNIFSFFYILWVNKVYL